MEPLGIPVSTHIVLNHQEYFLSMRIQKRRGAKHTVCGSLSDLPVEPDGPPPGTPREQHMMKWSNRSLTRSQANQDDW